jgi:hypothetical protein
VSVVAEATNGTPFVLVTVRTDVPAEDVASPEKAGRTGRPFA